MTPGPELDARVAEAVFNLERGACPTVQGHVCLMDDKGIVACPDCGWDLPRYSTDIAAAWQVVENLAAQGTHALVRYDPLRSDGVPRWTAVFGAGPRADADTAPHAIALAALAAVGEAEA